MWTAARNGQNVVCHDGQCKRTTTAPEAPQNAAWGLVAAPVAVVGRWQD